MIPVRVPATATTFQGRTIDLDPSHPLHGRPCPVCDEPLSGRVTLVYVGVQPRDRKTSGYMRGAAVTVHTPCAGPADDSSATVEQATP